VIRLTPNFWRVAVRVGGVVALFIVLTQWQSFHQGHWPDPRTVCSFSIPIILAPILVWFLFVPRLLEYSKEEINLRLFLGEGSYSWKSLEAYGPGRGVFMLQFTGHFGAYQILSSAYPSAEWSSFQNFLETQFPDKKRSFSIGGRLIR
jgi:hypothetical protein